MQKKITGIMVYYYIVCPKKLWYFANQISMEHTNKDVELGKLIDENSYTREQKHIQIGEEINIDFIKNNTVLHEVKKSKKIEKASIFQIKYYIYYLKKRGVMGITGKLDYPLLRQTVEVELSLSDELRMEEVLKEIEILIEDNTPPNMKKKGYCKNCAYFDLCMI